MFTIPRAVSNIGAINGIAFNAPMVLVGIEERGVPMAAFSTALFVAGFSFALPLGQ
ncbi:hypothetical protein OIDMADRAFT_46919 [Oidiodendron maius Zn]|uniref:Major facilitator superfamily (MFS) profile domain-containing protein n=1 Tax=Oidiodendron maius (strain Zn) TaxID=913774 RepID=A0A0C3HVI1_OIDMZ|nr:hypothetical protein OIDMADRAFT_46919 [Oidiodendron maius Zn]